MDGKEVIMKSLEHNWRYLTNALDGLTQEEFAWSPGAECNSIAFVLWHTARVEDFFIQRAIKRETAIYEAEGWQKKLGTPDKMYGFTLEELQAWKAPALEDLRSYANAVREKTMAFLNSIPAAKLDEVPRPDRSPDSIGTSLTGMATEIALHVGQICYLRGMQRGLDK